MALRAKKIARNQARLRELGLYKPQFSKVSAIAKRRKQWPVTKRNGKIDAAVSRGPQRRSDRISSLSTNPLYKEVTDFKELAPQHPNTRKRGTKHILDVDEITGKGKDERIRIVSKPTTFSRKPIASAPTANSVRTISLDVSIFVRKFLAKPLDTFGKYFVVETSFREAAYPEDQQRLSGISRLSFNKFSGVQPWKNAIFLWINVGGPTDANSLVNDFSHNGSRVTWFGGSKMREGSPVIQNLISMGKESTSSPSSSSGIILWCRQYDWETKKLKPYTCFGRLAYESHVIGSQPVAFTWKLIDYKAMIGNESTRNIFREISGLE